MTAAAGGVSKSARFTGQDGANGEQIDHRIADYCRRHSAPDAQGRVAPPLARPASDGASAHRAGGRAGADAEVLEIELAPLTTTERYAARAENRSVYGEPLR